LPLVNQKPIASDQRIEAIENQDERPLATSTELETKVKEERRSTDEKKMNDRDDKGSDIRPLGDKIVTIQTWALSEIENSMRPRLLEIRLEIAKADTVNDAKTPAKLLKNFKAVIDDASSHKSWVRVKDELSKVDDAQNDRPWVAPATLRDKLQSLKDITTIVSFDMDNVMDAMKEVLESSVSPQEIIQLVHVIKLLKECIDDPKN